MSKQLGGEIFVVAFIAFFSNTIVHETNAQFKMDFVGSTEFPSLKCITNPQQVTWDYNNRTVCFCVWIQYSVPTWNCIKADGDVTMDDLKFLIGTVQNISSGGLPMEHILPETTRSNLKLPKIPGKSNPSVDTHLNENVNSDDCEQSSSCKTKNQVAASSSKESGKQQQNPFSLPFMRFN